MKKNILPFSFLLLMVLFIAFSSFSISAAESNITYSGNAGEFIFEPGSDCSPTDLFGNFKDVVPGATLTQTVTLKNNADNKVKVKIYIRSCGEADGSDTDFLSHLKLTAAVEGSTPFFDANADETGDISDWKELGILYYGGKVNLKLQLTVPTELDNRYQDKIGKIKWQFYAIEMPVDEESWVCPECKKSHYRIVEKDGYASYVCEVCGCDDEMICELCHHRMKKVIFKSEDNRTWYYFVCENDANHHTEPAPQTGDESNIMLWIILLVATGLVLFILLFVIFRKKRNENKKSQ